MIFTLCVFTLASAFLCRLAYCEVRDTWMFGGKRRDYWIAAGMTTLALLCAALTAYALFSNNCGV